ncbi:hypothetical protein JL721_12548 [Aureococcus anophagefferens]|nr:hypothetical protein JL721_12548 [Aureococcus anophagefferens]
MGLPLVVVVVAAAASALDLGQGWRVSLDGDTITARRRGVPGLEALAVTFSVPSKLDLKNSSFDVVSQENGIGRGDEPISALVGAGAAGAADWSGQSADNGGGRVLFDWQPDGCLYPDWRGLVDELAAASIRVLTYASPFLTTAAVDGQPCRANRTSLYAHARDRGYLVTGDDGKPLLAREEVLSTAATAVAGFMADFGEHLPLVGAHLHSGADPLAYHNQMPDDWARLTRSAAVGSDALVFHRSGAPRTLESAGLFWAGDQEQSWQKNDGFASLPRTYAGSSGLAGWTQHSDVGGMIFCETAWLCERTDELLARWLELSAVVDPVLRSHPSNGQRPRSQPWSTGSNSRRTPPAVAIHVAPAATSARSAAARGFACRPPRLRHACARRPLLCRAGPLHAGGKAPGARDDVSVVPVCRGGRDGRCSRPSRRPARGRAPGCALGTEDRRAGAAAAARLGRPAIPARNGTAAAAALVAAAAALGPAW